MAQQTAMLSIRMDKELKESVGEILKRLGLDHSTVVNMLYREIQRTKEIPFSIKAPGNISLGDMIKEEQESLWAKATADAIGDQVVKGIPVTHKDKE